MSFSIQSDFKRMAKDVRALGKQAAFAQVVALTRTALAIREVEYDEMRSVFDRPTRYTLNSLFVKPAVKEAREAQIGVKDGTDTASRTIPPTKYEGPEIEGGARHVKRFERRLQRDGAMPDGWFSVPARAAKLDSDGNLNRQQLEAILAQLVVTKRSGFTKRLGQRALATSIRKAGTRYVAFPEGRGKLRPGIYAIDDSAGRSRPQPVLLFVNRADYARRFDFFGVAEQVGPAFYEVELETALTQYAGANQVN
jgi:hypothetical protein